MIGIQIGVNDATGRPQFLAVVSIACSREGAYPLTRMYLEYRSTAPHHLSSLTSQIAWRTDLVQSSSCRRQFLTPLKCSLPGWLPGSVNIEDHMTLSLPIPHSPDGIFRPPLSEALFELSTKRLQTRMVNGGEKATQAGSMRELSTSEQGHKGHGERSEMGKKFLESAFPSDGVAKEQHEEVDDLVLPKAPPHQTHLVCESLQHSLLDEIVCDEDDFGKPGRHRWPFLGGGLESNTRSVCNHKGNLPFRIPRHSRLESIWAEMVNTPAASGDRQSARGA